MCLAAGQQDGKKTALSICDCMDFRIAPTTRAAKRLIVLPPLWMARPSCAELLEMSGAVH